MRWRNLVLCSKKRRLGTFCLEKPGTHSHSQSAWGLTVAHFSFCLTAILGGWGVGFLLMWSNAGVEDCPLLHRPRGPQMPRGGWQSSYCAGAEVRVARYLEEGKCMERSDHGAGSLGSRCMPNCGPTFPMRNIPWRQAGRICTPQNFADFWNYFGLGGWHDKITVFQRLFVQHLYQQRWEWIFLGEG